MTPNKCDCGWHPHVVHVTDYMNKHTLGYYVYCEYCRRVGNMMPTPDEAIETWNTKEGNE